MDAELVKISKFLSLVLRHRPEAIGLVLDEYGWAEIDQIIQLGKPRRKGLTRANILAAVEQNDKQRFAISDDGSRIRANQGHSIEVDLQLSPVEPPEILYHGTVGKFLESILKIGLIPRSRQHVHLSPDHQTAIRVGQRRGKPIVLKIDAAEMHRNGHAFFVSENRVWLTDHVPAQFLQVSSTLRD